MPTDIEIAQKANMQRISKVALEKLGIADEHLEPYGHYKAKLSLDYLETLKDRPEGKLILVTAISPTPAGEGKTTTTVGLGDALNHIGKRAAICLREPSPPGEAMPRWCRWRTSTSTSRGTSTPSRSPTTCSPR